jgi:hypothetical protein
MGKRCVQLGDEYHKLPNVQMKLSVFHMVDMKYKFEAESEIRFLCKSFKKNLKTEGYNELVVLDHTEHEMVKRYYRKIGSDYAGATAELQKEVLVLKEQIKELEYKMEIQREQTERKLAEKEYLLEQEKNRVETLRTQITTSEIIYNLKLQLANSRSTKACPEDTLVS